MTILNLLISKLKEDHFFETLAIRSKPNVKQLTSDLISGRIFWGVFGKCIQKLLGIALCKSIQISNLSIKNRKMEKQRKVLFNKILLINKTPILVR